MQKVENEKDRGTRNSTGVVPTISSSQLEHVNEFESLLRKMDYRFGDVFRSSVFRNAERGGTGGNTSCVNCSDDCNWEPRLA